MKIKKEYCILVLLIVLLSIYLIFKKTDRNHYEIPKLPVIATNTVTKIEIIKPDSTIVLNKKDPDWLIAPHDYPADPDRIKKMLKAIKKIILTNMVSESKNYNRYNLDSNILYSEHCQTIRQQYHQVFV